jgi:four helix bundle protein
MAKGNLKRLHIGRSSRKIQDREGGGGKGEEGRGMVDPGTGKVVKSYKELRVYQMAMNAAMCIFELSKSLPAEEKFSMVDQVRRSSRSVCANIAEAWRRRRYEAHFVSKLNDAESEAEETRVWIEFAYRCGYLTDDQAQELDDVYNRILGQLVRMMSKPKQWVIRC